MMILLFKGMINLINLGMPMTNSEVAGPPQDWGCRGPINLTNKKHFRKYEVAGHAGCSLFRLKILYAVFLSSQAGGGGVW